MPEEETDIDWGEGSAGRMDGVDTNSTVVRLGTPILVRRWPFPACVSSFCSTICHLLGSGGDLSGGALVKSLVAGLL